ncbi:MAG TPA: Gfo/Idh/MocA family oxidoreductase [Candidatus Dormibacteraeota bacterium]|nr:Gfo/Idh/MocA family oxidoreductase [Candidatus Dormibacteraeota bacterium]
MQTIDAVGVAIVGYGLAGREIHGRLLAATPGLRVTAIVTANPQRQAAARADFPDALILSRIEELWSHRDECDLVVVATATGAHVAVATAALDAGLAVVVEKPLAATAAAARALVAHAARREVLLVPFLNRRWDSDHLTVTRLLAEGSLGTVLRYESRFERWRPSPAPGAWREEAEPEQGGGVLLDLGAHLVDQAITLFGPVEHVYAEVLSRRGGADDDVFMALEHQSGVVAHLWASALAAAPGPRLRVLGSRAAYVVDGLDAQESALRAGHRPDEPGFAAEPEDRWGWLVRGDEREPVPSAEGRWRDFYTGLQRCLREGAAPPVAADDAVRDLEVLDAARESGRRGVVVNLGTGSG